MKKIFALISMAALMLLSFSACSDDKDELISENALPHAAQTFISTYFPQDNVVKIVKDADKSQHTFEVYFSSGFEVEFDSDGNWIDVDAPAGQVVPQGIVPDAIASYVQEKYPSDPINEISRKAVGYETELASGLDLHFDSDGNFLYAER